MTSLIISLCVQMDTQFKNSIMVSAMVKKLDDSVGDIIESLSDKQMLNNTIILFLSDNGGAYQKKGPNFASNWPLRGTKFSPFEGGQRVVGLVWSPLVNTTNHLLKGFVHAVDWLPTILTAAGLEPPTEIDGIDQWNSILNNEDSIRNEIFDIYDDNHAVFKSAIIGDFKLITGVVEEYDYKGGDVRGIIGKGPSYIDAIKTCKMHSILYSTGINFDMNDINLRNDIRVQCKNTEYNMPMCIPDNGKGKILYDLYLLFILLACLLCRLYNAIILLLMYTFLYILIFPFIQ